MSRIATIRVRVRFWTIALAAIITVAAAVMIITKIQSSLVLLVAIPCGYAAWVARTCNNDVLERLGQSPESENDFQYLN